MADMTRRERVWYCFDLDLGWQEGHTTPGLDRMGLPDFCRDEGHDSRCGWLVREQQCEHEELVELIHTWSRAYPVEVFPEPDHSQTGHDPTLCSAAMGRHIIGRLMELLPQEAPEVSADGYSRTGEEGSW